MSKQLLLTVGENYVSPDATVHCLLMKGACLVNSNLFGDFNHPGINVDEPEDGDDYYYSY